MERGEKEEEEEEGKKDLRHNHSRSDLKALTCFISHTPPFTPQIPYSISLVPLSQHGVVISEDIPVFVG